MHGVNFEHLGPGKGFHITDYPDAERVIAIKGTPAQQLADYALHQIDLRNAMQCLDRMGDEVLDEFTRSMLWRMAVINYCRCFKNNNARPNNLSVNAYISDPDGIAAHEYFAALRDKNIAHDDNPLTQCLPGAIVNKSNAAHKIEKVITMSFLAETYADENIQNLRQLVSEAQRHVINEYDRLCVQITAELEVKSHTELMQLPQLKYSKPASESDVKTNRPKHG